MAATRDLTTSLEQPVRNTQPNALATAGRKLLLVYFGAVATVIEETYGLVEQLAEHREVAEKEGRRVVNELMERRKRSPQASHNADAGRAGEPAAPRTAPEVYPSRSDIEALNEKIARLTEQIDAIKQE